MRHVVLVDENTGEIIGKQNIDTITDVKRKKRNLEKSKLSKEYKNMQDEYLGKFVYLIMDKFEDLQEFLTDTELTRFIILGTYVKHNGYLMLDNNRTYIKKNMLGNILNMSNKNANIIYNKLIDKELLRENEGRIQINLFYFYKGSANEYTKITNKKLNDFTRIFIKTTRELYKNTKKSEISMLVVLYKLISFTNYKYNIICNNPHELNFEKIEPLRIKDIILIYGFDSRKANKFIKYIMSMSIGKDKLLMREGEGADIKNDILYVNPKLYYRWNDINELKNLIQRFDLCKI